MFKKKKIKNLIAVKIWAVVSDNMKKNESGNPCWGCLYCCALFICRSEQGRPEEAMWLNGTPPYCATLQSDAYSGVKHPICMHLKPNKDKAHS